MNDNLIKCDKCGDNWCYETILPTPNPDIPSIKSYHCFSCGFITNTLMKEGEEFFDEQMEVLPELYKDISFIDEYDKIWIPSTTNISDQGMVFIDGKDNENWGWAGVKAVPVKEEEKHKYPMPGKKGEFYSYRMDMSTLKNFGQEGYVEALCYVGIITEEFIKSFIPNTESNNTIN